MNDTEFGADKKKAHRKKHAGVSADKKKLKKQQTENLSERQRNPKAFSIQSVVRAEQQFRRKEDLTAKRQHIPIVDKTPDEPPPILIGVVGPPKVGKTTLIHNLIKNFTKTNVTNINGPITIVTSKKRRITLIECNNDINSMIDIAKCVDLVLLLCDASFGFEMEIFEFLNICQVHGMPKIMGILTHLDAIKNAKTLKNRKKELKHRFWTEVYNGAKLFYLSGIIHGEYLRNEITNLGRFISIMKFRPLTWRGAHSYVIADRMEDITNNEEIRLNSKCDRNIILYGYVRGVPMNKETSVHIAGLGDYKINELTVLPDPCPLPSREKKRNLLEKERLLYAPMSGVGGIVYDKDAVYIELQGSHSHHQHSSGAEDNEQNDIVKDLIGKRETFDEQIYNQEFKLFSDGEIIKSGDYIDTRNYIDEFNEMNNASDNDNDDDDDDDDVDDDIDEDSGLEEDDEDSQNWIQNEEENDDENIFEDDQTSDEEYQDELLVQRKIKLDYEGEDNNDDDDDEDDDDDDNDEDDDEDDEGAGNILKNNMSWKEGLAEKARSAYLERQADTQNLMKIVYGAFKKFHKNKQSNYNIDDNKQEGNKENDEEINLKEKIGGLFTVIKNDQELKRCDKENRNNDECCFFENYGNEKRDWLIGYNKNLIKNCFVTGKWRATEDAEELLRLDDLSDGDSDDNGNNENNVDADLYGDFEDLETGEKVMQSDKKNITKTDIENNMDNEKVTNKNKRKISRVEESNLSKSELLAKKLKLKAQFDNDYDKAGGGDEGRITGDHQYYDELKAEATKQSELNRNEFNKLDDNLRLQIEGYRAGLYVRLGFENISSEFVENFNPSYPLLIGGLNMSEENIGYVNCKVKKHRWYKRTLKTCDPLIVSLGWRRFQTIPIYAKIEDDMKHRYLKYTPNHITCSMTFWGPITPQNTGLLAIQSVQQSIVELKRIGFRIAATGCVTEVDKSTQIMKKLKLIGQPFKIYKKSAFIKGMFTSQLEVAKFEGAKIKTVSGIRGQIKKAYNKPEGSFRATFEDRILLSDIVFCRTWFRVDIPKFYAPVTTLLLPPHEKSQWQGMKTVGQLKRERNIRSEAKLDSMYKEITREPKRLKPLTIPKSLQIALPYKDKPKKGPLNPKQPFDSKRIAVVHSPHEQKIANMMKMLKTNYQAKMEKNQQDKELRVNKFKAQKRADELRRLKRQKELRKKVCRTISKMEKSKAATNSGESSGGGRHSKLKKRK